MRTREKLETWMRTFLPSEWEETWSWGASHDHPTIFNQKAVTHQRCFLAPGTDSIRETALAAKALGYSSAEPQPHGLDEAAPFVRLRLDAESLSFEFGIPSASKTDLANFAASLKDEDTFARFTALMGELGESRELTLRLGEAETEEWQSWSSVLWTEALEGLLSASNSELVFGTRWSRSETLEKPRQRIFLRDEFLSLWTGLKCPNGPKTPTSLDSHSRLWSERGAE